MTISGKKSSKKKGSDEKKGVYEGSEILDDVEIEDIESSIGDKVKKLQQKLKECQEEKQQYLDGWQREKADLLNIKRRQQEELLREQDRSLKAHIERLLPLCDSFEMAMSDTESWEKADPVWKKGIEQIHTQLEGILSSYGVTVVGIPGEVFDPNFHEAVSNEQVTEKSHHHTIVSVYQKGYRTESQLIRPAKVIVGEYSE